MFTAALIGRPNVGKSTLFNKLAGKRLALVDPKPGMTRDRREAMAEIAGKNFRIIDTAGFENAKDGAIEARMRAQSEEAMRLADFLIFMIDARVGVTPEDETFAALARKSGKPIALVANKAEGRAGLDGAREAYRLGLGDPIAISAEHGDGLGELFGELFKYLELWEAENLFEEETDDQEGIDPNKPIKVAIVGRPNAGKSTLMNYLLGEDRVITGPEAGLTRDSISVDMKWKDRAIRLFDTAGLRKKARVKGGPERISNVDALRAIQFAEVVVLLLDAGRPLEKQDLTICDLLVREGRALVIAINKFDKVKHKQRMASELQTAIDELLPQITGVPMITISALKGTGIPRLMNGVFETYEIWNKRVSTAKLNQYLQEATQRHPPPAVRGKRMQLRFLSQPSIRPPTFVVFCKRAEKLPASYGRYLINGIRETFDLWGVPIRLHVRGGKNPYVKDKDKKG